MGGALLVGEAFRGVRGFWYGQDEVPSPDRCSMAFFQTYCNAMKDDLINVFQELFSFGKFEQSVDPKFIALIPGKSGVSKVKDHRLISLMNGVYKIIFKVLANRLGEVLRKIITKPQNAFIQGRQVLNAVLITNE